MKVDSFLAVLKALHEHEVDYILVGGFAAILHGVPRVTEDVDIFVKRESANVEKLKKALHAVFKDESINELSYDDLEDYAVIRYGTPEDYYIDIMDGIGELFKYDDLKYEIIESQGIPIRVATIETLINLKKGTTREIDKADVILLMEKLKERK
ncbi:MAG: nucleotidyl transferase AbiEii/AbiGii toxin family protein [candidate division KSB1 bacterium]|nr:nucleotidyl transferase AbiEii/AbiGii toxin family protein [candidate division KSB1 bacterium]MDZ7304792.1 nucleotidyl transferase AbiEii/AbiGii toxin family protein [candidate division KSB1 bacterium]MDZ7313862.1 nucleotidyl transferase AbiEii/AbiGii toxin family protein [candidate division KSB1 bacterium]